jgi:hypothetical protein
VPEDVAHDLGTHAAFDLACCVAVSEDVRAEDVSRHTSLARMLADTVSNGAAGEALVWQCSRHEELISDGVVGTAPLQVSRQCLRYPLQQRQLDTDPRFRSAYSEDLRLPVDVACPQPDYFAGTQAIRSHQQEHRVIALTHRLVARNTAQDASDVGPGQCPRGTVESDDARPDHAACKISAQAAGHMQEAQEAPQGAATARYSPSCEPGRYVIDEGVDVDRLRSRDALAP